MTWEQKIQACQSLTSAGGIGFSLHMREPGDWYVHHEGVVVTNGSMESSGCVNGAKTPEEAAEKHWKWLTDLLDSQRVVVRHAGERRAYRWNGFMWLPFDEQRGVSA